MINEYLKSKLRARIDEEAKDSETYKILAEEASEEECSYSDDSDFLEKATKHITLSWQ